MNALNIDIQNLEYSLQLQCAFKIKTELIITGDDEFPNSEIETLSPSEFIKERGL